MQREVMQNQLITEIEEIKGSIYPLQREVIAYILGLTWPRFKTTIF